MKISKSKGIFLLEAVMALGIFSIFMSMTLPIVKNSIKIKSIAKSEVRYNRNFLSIMESINREIKNYPELIIENKGKNLTLKNIILKDDKYISKEIVYFFTKYQTLKRHEYVDGVSQKKEEEILENVEGIFFKEDEFIKLKIKYKNKEEEYVYR